ncbi:hypothetical protein [Cupriavidus basilensis]|uniref:Structural elements n=1 Tax=Cupriavidus basilensis TaxID=68895 RepID=A0A0C4YQ42_9BURK|nr:structural elements [Cupriavidus basilensis]
MENTTVFTTEDLDTYFASYVGMEGGNPRASVWFCDRSPHPWSEHLRVPLKPRLAPLAWDAAFRAARGASLDASDFDAVRAGRKAVGFRP